MPKTKPTQSRHIKPIAAWLPPRLRAQVEADARRQDRSISQIVGHILAEHYGLPLSKWKGK